MKLKRPLLACVLGLAIAVVAETDKSRVFVLTDISNEPDDEQSMVRFLVYANEYDIEGLVASTSTWLRNTIRGDLIHRQLDAYSQVRPNLLKHDPGFPTAESLRASTRAPHSSPVISPISVMISPGSDAGSIPIRISTPTSRPGTPRRPSFPASPGPFTSSTRIACCMAPIWAPAPPCIVRPSVSWRPRASISTITPFFPITGACRSP
jgi:hypothetical protein